MTRSDSVVHGQSLFIGGLFIDVGEPSSDGRTASAKRVLHFAGGERRVQRSDINNGKMPTAAIEAAVQRQLEKEMARDRREARRSARLRCRARELLETADAAQLKDDSVSADDAATSYEIRPLAPLELGLAYLWMQNDEAEFPNDEGTDDAQRVTRWWSGGAIGLQETWEVASLWYDDGEREEEQSDNNNHEGLRPAEASIATLRNAIESNASVARRHCGEEAARTSVGRGVKGGGAGSNKQRRPHFLGAFANGIIAPVGFVATKLPPSRMTDPFDEWSIDALGTRIQWRGRGVGSALARYCIDQAHKAAKARACAPSAAVKRRDERYAQRRPEAAAALEQLSSDEEGVAEASVADEKVEEEEEVVYEYCIDVVPSAVGFWTRLGFEEVEAVGEQAYMMSKGGDRPMVLRLRV